MLIIVKKLTVHHNVLFSLFLMTPHNNISAYILGAFEYNDCLSISALIGMLTRM